MDIPDLLNPEPSTRLRRRGTVVLKVGRNIADEDSPDSSPTLQGWKKKPTKIAKDAAKFEKGMTTGQVRFPPHETQNEELQRIHDKLHLFPKSGIDKYPRHIPYNSDKKTFQISTGRHSFEVFQYKFRFRDLGKEWVVMWDYNIGLVRVTPFFKALGYVKTVPAKAIAMSPGLKEMCFSITGGSIAAQGYWIPFEAAKALAATFCWQIRFALTPIFGDSFPELCIQPEDPAFQRFSIDPDIVARCQEEVLTWRVTAEMPQSSSGTSTPTIPVPAELDGGLQLPRESTYELTGSSDGSEQSHQDGLLSSVRRQSKWTAANESHSSSNATSGSTSPNCHLSRKPVSMVTGAESCAAKRCLEDTGNEADESSMALSDSNAGSDKRRRVYKYRAKEMKAAQMLLQLSRGV